MTNIKNKTDGSRRPFFMSKILSLQISITAKTLILPPFSA